MDAIMSGQRSDLPEFDNPPVVETALGVQFAPAPGMTCGHFGWYWRTCLDESWTKTAEAPPLIDQFERFGEKRTWSLPIPQVKLMMENPVRLQIISESDDRVIQLQNSRFVYNWRKKDAHYPRFDALYPEFMEKLRGFRDFLRKAELEDISPNQWEITYVNHIPKGELWESPADWHNLFPGLYLPPRRLGLVRPEGITGEWHFEITPQRGRVHVSGQHVKRVETGEEALQVQLVSRGPIEQEGSVRGIAAGIELGHQALVQTFVNLSSDAAHRHWGIRRDARHNG
jgi:uncharacterized protein (TIGR04255 family)